jgi:ParB/RepB/Spo0J family partition protein
MASEREPAQRSKHLTLTVKKLSVGPALKNVSENRRMGMQTRAQPYTASSQQLKSIPIAQIQIVGSRRTLDEETVRILSLSIEQSGLRNPISVIAGTPSGRIYNLVTGVHRLEASKRLGRSTIDAFVMEEGQVDVSRWRIEENLLRRDLNVLNTAEATAEWVRLAEADFGHVVHKPSGGRPEGGVARAARQLPVAGKSEEARRKAVERAIRIDQISAEAKTAAINAGFADNQRTLLEIAKQPTLEAQLLKVEELSAVKRARPKRDNSAPVGGIGGEAPVAASPSSAPVDSPNTRTKPDGDDLGSAPVEGIGGEAPVAGSPASAPADPPNTRTKPDGDGLDIPEFLNRRDPAERTFAGLKAEWQNAAAFRHACAAAPVAVRDKFFAEVMQHYRE